MNDFNNFDWVYVLGACVTAMLLGVWLAKKQAQAFSGKGDSPHTAVTFSDYGDMRFLHLGSPAVQGSMKISQPFDLHLEYVQRMMAWLLFVDLDKAPQMKAMQLGLGAASLTKFCYRRIGMHTTAMEINPQVIAVCKTSFHLPDNSARLHVVQGNAADIALHDQWIGQIDVLQVDLYDHDAKQPVLDSEAFYRDCHTLLSPTSCMVVNVFGETSNANQSIRTLAAIFGPDALWSFTPTGAGNTIVLAFAQPPRPQLSDLQAQARAIEARWGLPAQEWLNALTPVLAA
jgi:spermidine synthase